MLIELLIGDDRVDGFFVNEKKDYHCATVWKNGKFYCTCKRFYYSDSKNKPCKHVNELIEAIKSNGDETETFISNVDYYISTQKVMEMNYAGEYVKSGVKVFDELVGGLPVGTALGVFGPQQSGKSVFGLEYIYKYIAQKKRNVLYIDTESANVDYTLASMHEKMKSLYGIKSCSIAQIEFSGSPLDKFYSREMFITRTNAKHKIYTMNLMTLEELFAFLGQYIFIQVSNKGMAALKQLPTFDNKDKPIFAWNSRLSELITKHNIGFIVLDSLTAPVEDRITGGESNHPVRTEIEHVLLSRLNQLLRMYRASGYIIMHEARSGAMMKITPKPKGGTAVHHNFKFLVRMRRSMTKKKGDRTMLSLYRHQDERARDVYITQEEYPLFKTEYGFSSDMEGNDIKEFIEQLKKAEKEKEGGEKQNV